jgi:hypothetical protein
VSDYYTVIRQTGARWDPSRGLREQAGWDEHAAFMDALAAEGFVVLGGPIDGGEGAALHAGGAEAIEARLADDPCTPGMLRTASVWRWRILLRSPSAPA